MKSYQAKYRISTMCRTLGVSASGYYAWLLRTPSARKQRDIALGDRIEAIHRRSRNTYGRPRIKAELKDDGITLSNDRLARLMNERKLQGASRRKGIRTTVRDRDARPAPDLSIVSSSPTRRTSFGLLTSRTCRLMLVSCSCCRSRRVQSANRWLGDELEHANAVGPRRAQYGDLATPALTSFITQTKERNTRRSHLVYAAAKRTSGPRWDRLGTATTTRCARASTPRWNANCSTSTGFARIRRRSSRSSTSSKDGTIFTVGTPHSATDRRRPSSGKPPHDFPISNYPRKPGNFIQG